jgi:hypothetical protein
MDHHVRTYEEVALAAMTPIPEQCEPVSPTSWINRQRPTSLDSSTGSDASFQQRLYDIEAPLRLGPQPEAVLRTEPIIRYLIHREEDSRDVARQFAQFSFEETTMNGYASLITQGSQTQLSIYRLQYIRE